MAEASLVRQRSYKNNSEADRARFAEELEGAGLSEELIAARLNIGVKKSQAESSFSLVSAEEARRAALELRAEECPDLARLLNLIGDKDPRGNLCDGVLCCNGSVDDPFSRGHWDAGLSSRSPDHVRSPRSLFLAWYCASARAARV